VEAYRSLGKALLEKKEYAEAKDVFLGYFQSFQMILWHTLE